MRYRVVAVGKLKSAFYREACEHYLKRLGPLATCEVIEVREAREADVEATKLAEGAALLAKVQGLSVALDEHGRTLDTRALARRVSALENRGVSQATILVGGAEGHGRDLLGAVDETW
ncbi:MAG TPA: 23S rRNA (pseudouridine(1915)-N(3))-methyltransferase RlmH, partial [Trueperaceae bacterium]|nr:23S rRNA (pseudouridine(1915)-N(3))-methyltransferase RlmH [Trueperaceae bacterium]